MCTQRQCKGSHSDVVMLHATCQLLFLKHVFPSAASLCQPDQSLRKWLWASAVHAVRGPAIFLDCHCLNPTPSGFLSAKHLIQLSQATSLLFYWHFSSVCKESPWDRRIHCLRKFWRNTPRHVSVRVRGTKDKSHSFHVSRDIFNIELAPQPGGKTQGSLVVSDYRCPITDLPCQLHPFSALAKCGHLFSQRAISQARALAL